jgi:hypothetical protein
MTSSDGLPIVFGENGGYYSGDAPLVEFPGSLRKRMWMRAKCGLAGRCTNWTPSQPRQPEADFGQICVFLFRRKVSLPLPANLRNAFPKRTPIGRVSAVQGPSRQRGA